MLEDKEINRKITKKCKSKVIRDSTRVGAVRAKKKKKISPQEISSNYKINLG